MTDFKLSDPLHVFLFLVIPFCLATDASDELRHARFMYDNFGDDNCGCQIGKCIHLSNGGFRCDCYDPAWTGEKCDTLAWTLSGTQQPIQQPKIYDQSCSYHGQITSAGCSCHDNWGGNICQFAPGTLDHCNLNCGHGHCAVHTDPSRHVEVHLCECEHGWHGEHCKTRTQPMQMDHCHNHCQHGVCVGPDMNYYYHCQCDQGWHGGHCEYERWGSTHTDRCNNECQHGVCVGPDINGYSHCQCDTGWYGTHCKQQSGGSTHTDRCNNECQHGVCVGPDINGYSHCQCDTGWYGTHCKQQSGGNQLLTESTTNTPPTKTTTARTTTTKPTTTTTTKATTTTRTTTTPKTTPIVTTQPPVSATSHKSVIATTTHSASGISPCDKSAVLLAVAKLTEVVNQNAEECSTGSHASHDALLLTHCQVPGSASSWQQGTNVMSHCSGSASLPTYIAVAAFDNGVYSSKGSLSGIFLGCTANGFKMAFQSCGQLPQIAEITMGGTNALNPLVYYTVV